MSIAISPVLKPIMKEKPARVSYLKEEDAFVVFPRTGGHVILNPPLDHYKTPGGRTLLISQIGEGAYITLIMYEAIINSRKDKEA